MRIIDADKLMEEMRKQAGCDTCNNWGGIKCRSCPWDDAMTAVDDFADNKPFFDEDRVV